MIRSFFTITTNNDDEGRKVSQKNEQEKNLKFEPFCGQFVNNFQCRIPFADEIWKKFLLLRIFNNLENVKI